MLLLCEEGNVANAGDRGIPMSPGTKPAKLLDMRYGGKRLNAAAVALLAAGVLAGCGSSSGDYPAPAELEQEAQIEQYQDQMDQQYDEWAQDAWEDDLVTACMDDQIANGYNSYQAEAYCQDNFDQYMPEPEPDYGYEDYGYEDYGYEEYDYGRW